MQTRSSANKIKERPSNGSKIPVEWHHSRLSRPRTEQSMVVPSQLAFLITSRSNWLPWSCYLNLTRTDDRFWVGGIVCNRLGLIVSNWAHSLVLVSLMSKFWPGTTNKTFNHCHGLPFGIFACYNYHCYDESLEPEGEMSGGRPGFSYEDEEVCLVFRINL